MEEIMTSEEVAKAFGVGTVTVRKWAREGILPHLSTPGGRLRFRRSEVEKHLR